jgi:formylmethanofuran dehydrogenase subunit A
MSNSLLKIAGGSVFDPAHGIEGQVGDLWIENDRIVAPPGDPAVRPARTIDASGLVVMPGGIDIHCHIASLKVNAARKLRPDERQAIPDGQTATAIGPGHRHCETLSSVPNTRLTGAKYAALGYTTAFDAAVPPLAARDAHLQLADTPYVDKGCYILLGNHHFVLEAVRRKEFDELRNFVAWILAATRAYGVKIVNPGGVEAWKQHAERGAAGLDEPIAHFQVTPRAILESLAQAADRLALPHPVHIHANDLGMPGNWTTTLQTMRALDGRRAHFTHIQFHSYGGQPGEPHSLSSMVEELAQYVNTHPGLTIDVGQVLFGRTTAMTGDSPLGYFLHKLYGGKWVAHDVEQESGCGIVPLEYRDRALVHALQWAIGLEWYLLVEDPWRVVMSTDHPNGGSFWAYPEIVRLLMDRDYRREAIRRLPKRILRRTRLAGLDRQYSLSEICIITRAGPARILGLANKGHLGPGADADVTIYAPGPDPRAMFEFPRWVIKSGQVLCDDGELREPVAGRTLSVAPEYDRDLEPRISRWFNDRYSIQYRNFPITGEQWREMTKCP